MYRVNIDQGQNWKCRDLNATGLRFYVDSFLSLIWDFQIEFTNRTSSNFWERRPVLPWKGLSIKILQDERKMLPRLFMKNILQRRMGWSMWNTSLFVFNCKTMSRFPKRDVLIVIIEVKGSRELHFHRRVCLPFSLLSKLPLGATEVVVT